MRIALGVEYDGTEFYGWQRQRSGRTVQACLEKALSRIADHNLTAVCAGRTDTGVHATAQVVHIDTEASRDEKAWIRGTNTNLPPDVRIQWAREMDEAFHARFSARRRHYRYVILNRSFGSAQLRNRVCREYADLDVCRMRDAAAHLIGEHDFTSFRAAACQARNPVRTIYQLDVSRNGRFIYIDVLANAFLHHMVRCIAGILISAGRGDVLSGSVRDVLDARDRTAGGVTAPAAGLYLVAVKYPGRFDLPAGGWLPEYGH
ncbi:MAG: tRNA pseudouridine(38-40) synthase TruA [Pseudomonadota bacterium]|nr:tRNA pseudouridine(38-40) synthase TruA [Pseudomonadota bacterium]